MPVPWRSGTRTTVAGPAASAAALEQVVERARGDERQVDRQDDHGLGAAGDDSARACARAGVEAAVALAEGPRPRPSRQSSTAAVRADDQDVGRFGRGSGRRHRSVPAAADQVLPLLGVERPAEARLGALDRPRPG